MQADPQRRAALEKMMARGGGMVVLHWAMGTKEAKPIDDCLNLLGGCHGGPDRKYAVVETGARILDPKHPVAAGIKDFRVKDEFYYRLKFTKADGLKPLLAVKIEDRDETVAWTWERPAGGRAFGFSGLHFHDNWRLPEYRRLVTQGVLWTLRLPVPAEGLPVKLTEDDLKLAAAPKTELLWPNGAPGAMGTKPTDQPSITVYLPPADKATGTGVVVCPGGGYSGLAVGHEGKDVAEWFNQRGVAAFVLRYRVAPYKHPAPMLDAQRAVRTVRSRAKEFGVDPKRVGIMGFSAGGHLASTVATHFDDGKADADDPIDRQSCRPDFAVLCYPVITLKPPYAHMGSRNNLLGKEADEKLVQSLCNDEQVTDKTPPTFLFHTDADTGVKPENSILFYLALKKAKVPAEMHIYEKGPHGVGLAPKDPILSTWADRLDGWLQGRGLLKKN
jgi:acetyl esterase/lipase